MYYTAIVEGGDGDGFSVFFPDVPGCYSHGATIQAAAENAAEALALYFEDSDERPAPTPVDAVTVDPDVVVAAKILVPAPDTDGPIERYTVTLPSGLVKRVDRRVGSRRRSAFLADAMRKALAAE
jgi:predicted RNase H-like HicB family nuclease